MTTYPFSDFTKIILCTAQIQESALFRELGTTKILVNTNEISSVTKCDAVRTHPFNYIIRTVELVKFRNK